MYNFDLRPYQTKGVKKIKEQKYILCGDQPGLGKTFQALKVIFDEKLFPCVIVTPAFLKTNWAMEIKKYVNHNRTVTIINDSSYDKGADIFIINYETMSKYASIYNGVKAIVFDECHYLKNPDAKRTQRAYDLVKLHKPRYCIMLSGTPIKNHYGEFWQLFRFLEIGKPSLKQLLAKYDSHYRFLNTFCFRKEMRIRGRTVVKYEGSRNKPMLTKLLKNNFYRRTLEAVQTDIPDLVENEIIIDINNNSVDIELCQLYSDLKEGTPFITKKTKSAIAKTDYTTNMAIELNESTHGPVIIFSAHQGPVELINSTLRSKGLFSDYIHGGVDTKKRNGILQNFRNGKLQFLVATIGAAGTGLTLTNSNQIIFNDISYVETDNEQARKRIHRLGQERTCFIHYILCGEIDQKIKQIIKTKKQTSEGLI